MDWVFSNVKSASTDTFFYLKAFFKFQKIRKNIIKEQFQSLVVPGSFVYWLMKKSCIFSTHTLKCVQRVPNRCMRSTGLWASHLYRFYHHVLANAFFQPCLVFFFFFFNSAFFSSKYKTLPQKSMNCSFCVRLWNKKY